MKTLKSTLFFLIFLLFCLEATGQNEASLLFNWDKRRARTYEKINKVIAATNGYVVAVGETLGASLKDRDGLFLVIQPEDGKEMLRKTFSASGEDFFHSGVQNPDGSFTLVGSTKSGPKNPGSGWLVQVDVEGRILFEKILPGKGSGDAEIRDIAVSPEGVALAAGWKNSQRFEGIWVLEIGPELVNEYTVGGPELGKVEGIAAGSDEGFVLVGTTPKEYKPRPADAWALKIDKSGHDLWGGPKFFGDNGWQEGRGITGVSDGGYALIGATATKGAGGSDKWLIKLNRNGDLEWDKTYGGAANDAGICLIELSVGGYALFGQTWSRMINARYSTLELHITDEKGNVLDDNAYAIRQVEAEGDEVAHSIVETFTGDLVFSGSSFPAKSSLAPTCQVSAVAYQAINTDPGSGGKTTDRYGSLAETVRLSPVRFSDPNGNALLEAGERGYFALEIENAGSSNLHQVSGRMEVENQPSGLDFWTEIKIGTLRAGQKKRIFIPVGAKGDLPSGEYPMNISVMAGATQTGSSRVVIKSDTPEPPKLMAEGHFTPASPRPGEPVTLQIRLLNSGGSPTLPMEVRINTPQGVQSIDSEAMAVPALRPNERKDLSFTFSYAETYPLKSIDIRLEGKNPKMPLFVKTFRLDTGKPAPSGDMPDQMVWVSHEPRREGVNVNDHNITVKVAAISKNKLEKEKFSLLIAGKKVEGQKMGESDLTPPESNGERNVQYYTQTVRLKEGMNRIQIVYGENSVIKSPEIIFNYLPKDKPNLYVLTIGVKYDNLKYTVKDAGDIANAFLKLKNDQERVFKNIEVYPLLKEEETTTQNIKIAFEELRKKRIKDGDLVIVFISSHGKVTQNNQFLILPSDYSSEWEKVFSVNFETDILDPLQNIAGNRLVFIDACHSGSVTEGAKAFTDQAMSKVLKDLLSATAGLEIFASCGENEYSYEDDSWANGAFTKAILEAFSGQTVEADGKMIQADRFMDNPETGRKELGSDGVITIGELREFLKLRVPHLVRKVKGETQNPHNRSTDLLPENTGIYMIDKKF